MPIITEVEFGHEHGALAETLDTLPELSVSVVRETRTDPRRSLYLMRFDDPDTDLAAVLTADSTVRAVEPMPGFEEQQVWGVEFAADTMLISPRVTNDDGFVLDASSTAVTETLRGWHERWLLPDREALHDIWDYARSNGFEFEVLAFRRQGETDFAYSGPDAPTDQQREALITAYHAGYFSEPRETSLDEIATELDISPTAAAGRLKRGMQSLIAMTLAVDESQHRPTE